MKVGGKARNGNVARRLKSEERIEDGALGHKCKMGVGSGTR